MRIVPVLFAKACAAAVVALAGLAVQSAQADIIVSYQDVGSDLQFSWSGSLSAVPGTNAPGTSTVARIASPNTGGTLQDLYALGGSYDRYSYSSVTRTPSGSGLFGQTFNAINGTRTGDTFAVTFPSTGADLLVFLPFNYQANDPVVGTLTIPNASVASTGLSDVSFGLDVGGNVTFQAAAVPEPSTLALCGVAVAGLGFAGVRRLRRPPATRSSRETTALSGITMSRKTSSSGVLASGLSASTTLAASPLATPAESV